MIVDRRPLLAAVLILATMCGVASGGQGQGTPRRDSADKDYAPELPRFPLKDPAEALRAIVARPGFRLELVAAEPLLRSPVAVDFDEDGRLYVAEFPEYNQYV